MNWYKGGIAEAISASRQLNSIFVVYTEGQDDKSMQLREIIEQPDVAQVLGGADFTAIKVEGNSVTYQQFSEIYKQVPIPSIYFIGKGGAVLDIVKEVASSAQLMEKINSVLKASGKSITANFLAAEQSTAQSPVKNENQSTEKTPSKDESDSTKLEEASPKEKETTPDKIQDSPEKKPEEQGKSGGESSSTLTPEEKVDRAKELLEKKREAKLQEEKAKEKAKELERRKLGQDVQKLRSWQQEQEMKNILEQREKEKREEKMARQRVLDQIKQDKADRASRFGSAGPITPPKTEQQAQQSQPQAKKASPKVPPNHARLQFKLPDGSTKTNEFESASTLMEIRNYVSEIVTMRVTDFALSTTFPRREFTNEDNTKTLIELELVPNAVILVLPLTHGTISTANSNGGFLYSLIWTFLTPILNLFNYLRGFVIGGGNNPPTSPAGATTTSGNQANSGNEPSSSRVPPKRGGGSGATESTVVKRQGNIHRLSDKRDSDEDNNTWNGNSTQQM